MSKTFIFSCALFALTTSVAQAGDTVTINLPGGATQTVTGTAIAAAINSGQFGGLNTGGGTSTIIASVVQNPTTGDITFTTTGGKSYTVSSAFIVNVLNYYRN